MDVLGFLRSVLEIVMAIAGVGFIVYFIGVMFFAGLEDLRDGFK